MRAFIAIETPRMVESELKEAQGRLVCNSKLSYTRSFHLTLKFLGEIDEKLVPEIIKHLNEIKQKSFTASLNYVGAFPNVANPRVIYADVSPEKEITELHSQVNKVLEGMFKKESGFCAHITLARVKELRDKLQLKSLIISNQIKNLDFKVSEFKFFQSELLPDSPKYTELGKFKLQ